MRGIRRFVALVALGMLPVWASYGAMRDYVWNVEKRGRRDSAPQRFLRMLEEEVGKMLKAGILAPCHLRNGINIVEPPHGTAIWWRPRETVLALSYAYRHLPAAVQQELKGYLRRFIARSPPWSARLSFRHRGAARREYYMVPDSVNPWVSWKHPDAPTFYALWRYAEETGDWELLEKNWKGLSKLFGVLGGAAPQSYGDIGGMIGLARIAKRLGREAEAARAEMLAVEGMKEGLKFSEWNDRAYSKHRKSHEIKIPVFYDLTPEVGSYMHDNLLEQVSAELDRLTLPRPRRPWPQRSDRGGNFAFWWGTHVERMCNWNNSEVSTYRPEVSMSIFSAKAHAVKETGEQLGRYIDVPFALGDLDFIRKVTAVLDAFGSRRRATAALATARK